MEKNNLPPHFASAHGYDRLVICRLVCPFAGDANAFHTQCFFRKAPVIR
jgi:hypothetical protein